MEAQRKRQYQSLITDAGIKAMPANRNLEQLDRR
jgi:hypothetical protein